MQVRTLDPVADAEAWMRLLGAHRHDFYHLPGYLSMSASADDEAIGIEVRDGESSLFQPLVLRPISGSNLRDATSPYGYPGPIIRVGSEAELSGFVERAASALLDELARRRVIACFVRLHPLLTQGTDGLAKVGFVERHGDTVSVDLTQDERAISRGMRSGHRTEIKQARKQGQRAYVDETWRHFEDFYEIYNETMERLGAQPSYFFPRDYYERLREALGPRLHLGVVDIEGTVAAAGLFTETSGIVQYHLSGTRGEFMRQRPTKVLLDELIHWAKQRGNRDFHLGGGVGGEGDSLFRFKAGFSKRHHPFHTWRAVGDKQAYERLARERGVPGSAEDLSGFFPAYRRG